MKPQSIESAKLGSKTLLEVCGRLESSEKALIICDNNTEKLGRFIYDYAVENGHQAELEILENLKMHGQEPPQATALKMLEHQLILGMTSFSMAHTKARQNACQAGARYLSLPDYSFEVLESKALQADFEAEEGLAQALTERLDRGTLVNITTRLGTNLSLKIDQRAGNNCVGILREAGGLSSPPDMEVNIAPLEEESQGILVVDGCIPHPLFGVIKNPVKLYIKDGLVTKFESENRELVQKLDVLFNQQEMKARTVAEFGIGLNPLAVLDGGMLEAEGCKGSIHCGIGANSTIGGRISVPFHLDFVVTAACVSIDGEVIMRDGVFLIG